MYENWKILKSQIEEKQEEYYQVAEWCNQKGSYHIEEQGEYYAVALNAEPSAEELKAREIAELKQKLADTDYVVIKIAEGVATAEQYAGVIAQRQQWRARINELEG